MSSQGQHSPEGNQQKVRVYYDGDCAFCVWAVNKLKAVDFSRKIRWTPFVDVVIPPGNMTREEFESAAHVELKDGKFYSGFYAFRRLTLIVPSLWPLVPIMWFPGMQFPGQAAYRWIAANRGRLYRWFTPHRKERSDSESNEAGQGDP